MLNPQIENPPAVTPPGWDDRFEPFPSGPMPRTEQSCGCYIRLGDYESILCSDHLAELNIRPQSESDGWECPTLVNGKCVCPDGGDA